jgi:hypothetical protein
VVPNLDGIETGSDVRGCYAVRARGVVIFP